MKTKKFTKLPVLVTLGNFIFPNTHDDLDVGRVKSLAALKSALNDHDGKIIVVTQKDAKIEDPIVDDIYHIGSLCTISLINPEKFETDWANGKVAIHLKGENRVKLTNIKNDPFFQADADIFGNKAITKSQEEELIETIVGNLQNIFNTHGSIPNKVISQITDGMRAAEIIDKMAKFLPYLTVEKRQEILSEANIANRLNILLLGVEDQKHAGDIEKELNNRVKDNIDEQQRIYYLRERLKAIKEELGEIEGGSSNNEVKTYRDMLENNPYPESMKTRILEEIARYEEMPQNSSEANIMRTYIDWVMSLPWYMNYEEKNFDLKTAQKTLDKFHYGLEKVKERIIEYLAVKKMAKAEIPSQIICLVGPPGVGKTSLAKSIATAMNRVFVKVSLGGVKDESEIRGHRRTYLGAMPGRIIQGMKKAKVMNPVFLLDEIDKMSSDYRGDPASAMLEVLDPEQNKAFSDHYIEENYDLSKVMFIATANYMDGIPEPLRDRMEIIELSSYTEIEKLAIAKKYLIPRVNKASGLTNRLLKYQPSALEEIIKFYTREAGVRQLERLLHKIARKYIVKYLNKDLKSLTVSNQNISEYLGKRIFDYTKKDDVSQVGVVIGLAYTQFGGDILPIEVNYFKGKGNLVLTGKLGEVMKESASIALDYIKANSDKFDIDPKIFSENDIHIHVPEGAVPKDGPSAGITLTTSIISALTGTPVSKDIGMTGEITLRGHVLPIGGLREKSISAHRSHLKTILIPKANLKDLDDIPEEVKKKLKIVPVEFYRDVYDIIFNKNKVALPSTANIRNSEVTTITS